MYPVVPSAVKSDWTKELAGNNDHVQGSWAMEPKSEPATMIMYTGFLSDGTKELAGNYDHVSRVPERQNPNS